MPSNVARRIIEEYGSYPCPPDLLDVESRGRRLRRRREPSPSPDPTDDGTPPSDEPEPMQVDEDASKKRPTAKKMYVWTLNNYTEEEIERIQEFARRLFCN